MEDDYARKLLKLAKHSFGTGETGHLDRAILQSKSELEAMARSHTDLANLVRGQEAAVGEFLNKREGGRKNHQTAVEKKWKELQNTRHHVLKAKDKYSTDAISINALHAQASLLQGRELDKATLKLDKAQQTVQTNERDYRQYVGVLREMTGTWNMMWKSFCDLCQDQEEERLEFLKGRLWDWANALSTVAMAEDESAERTRTALEQCEPATDIKIFVQGSGTGNSIPDPLPFIDYTSGANPPKQTYQIARFKRSSTRGATVKHSPSAVDDIARAFHQQPQQGTPQRQSTGAERPQSRGAGLAPSQQSSSNLSASPSASDVSPSQETTPTRPAAKTDTLGRFAVSPSANLRGSSERVPSSSSSNMPNGRSNGQIAASAFQRQSTSPSPGLSTSVSAASAMANSASPLVGTSPKPYSAPIPQQQEQRETKRESKQEEEDDPLAQALRTLQMAGAGEAPRVAGGPQGPRQTRGSQDGGRPTHRQSQQSLGRSFGAPPPQEQTRSRPSSPAPVAAMMQPPSHSQPRPSSRQGSAVGAPSQNRYSSHSQSGSQVGVGARGRSPSPQPFSHPDALRPHSPNPNPPRSSSPSPYQSQQSFGGGQQQQYGGHQKQPSLGAPGQQPQGGQQYARAPSPGPQGYGRAPSPSPSPQKSHMGSQQFRSPSPSPHQGYRAPSPQPQQQFQPPPSQQYPSQQFQQQQHYQSSSSIYSANPSPALVPIQSPYAGSAPSPNLYQQQPQPHQAFRHPNTSPYNAAQIPTQHQLGIGRSPSVVSGASSAVSAGPGQYPSGAPPPVQYAPPPQQQQPMQHQQQPQPIQQQPIQHQSRPQQQPQQAQQSHGGSQVGAPTPVGPPTGQWSDDGKPILFYVNAIYSYTAASAEEFSFSEGDVIAVTDTDPDGWWKGNKVGVSGGGKLFPSNFTELLA